MKIDLLIKIESVGLVYFLISFIDVSASHKEPPNVINQKQNDLSPVIFSKSTFLCIKSALI